MSLPDSRNLLPHVACAQNSADRTLKREQAGEIGVKQGGNLQGCRLQRTGCPRTQPIENSGSEDLYLSMITRRCFTHLFLYTYTDDSEIESASATTRGSSSCRTYI